MATAVPSPLPRASYAHPDATLVARHLLGKRLVTRFDQTRTAGIIVETEAYDGQRDLATVRHLTRRGTRARWLYGTPGTAYVYLVYHKHLMFNVVTGPPDHPAAVLVRAIEPTEGLPLMVQRRGLTEVRRNLTAGPAVMSQALGLTTAQLGLDLTTGDAVWLEEAGPPVADADVVTGPRVGIPYAGADVALPWRFSLRGNRWVSPAKGG